MKMLVVARSAQIVIECGTNDAAVRAGEVKSQEPPEKG
jgi:hypothetical protein